MYLICKNTNGPRRLFTSKTIKFRVIIYIVYIYILMLEKINFYYLPTYVCLFIILRYFNIYTSQKSINL